MYVTTVFPTQKNHTLDIPEEFYDKEIIITAQTVDQNDKNLNQQQFTDIENIFNKYRKIDLTNFKFDRNEANNFDV